MIREFGTGDIVYLVFAARWTLALTALAFTGGACVGLILAVLRISSLAPLRIMASLYIQIVQGTPLLVWLFLTASQCMDGGSLCLFYLWRCLSG